VTSNTPESTCGASYELRLAKNGRTVAPAARAMMGVSPEGALTESHS
jgi:hypothetical protein